MLPTSPQSAFDWEGGSIDDLVQLLAGPALAVRVEVRTPSAGKPRKVGEIHMVAGGVYEVLAGELRGDEAMEQLRTIHPVSFRLQPRLPNPENGSLQVPGPSEGTLAERPAAEIMRYCELYVLTCTVELWRDTDRAEIEYRKGEIARTLVNNDPAEARLPEILSWESGGYRIVLPALNLPAPARAPQAVRAPLPAQKTPQPVSPPRPAATSPGSQAAPVKAPARTIFGMPAAQLPVVPGHAAEPVSRQPQASAEPARTTAAGMRVDVDDRSSPERTTNTGVPVMSAPRQEEAAPAKPQGELTTLPRAEPVPSPRKESRPESTRPRETEKIDSAREHKPQKQQPKKKEAPVKSAPERERRPAAARPEQAVVRKKGEMSLMAHIGIGLALGFGLAAIWWIIQMVKGG